MSSSSSSSTGAGDDDDNAVMKSRKYDLSISYDNYYRTPRIWLFGYDENGSILTQYKLFEGEFISKIVLVFELFHNF